ncbi:MAG: caspase family protein, partial [Planctomycetales bacterium]|nr:caspase family protein [Planctomycetales bacterium]
MRKNTEGRFDVRLLRAGKIASSITTDLQPYSWSFLRSKDSDVKLPVVLSTYGTSLTIYEAAPSTSATFQPRREFWGGHGFFTSCSESPDGRFLAAANTDGMIRIYSLEHFERRGSLDFDFDWDENLSVVEVGPRGKAEGFRVGDTLLTADGVDFGTFLDRAVNDPDAPHKFHEGQVVRFAVQRGGAKLNVDVALPRGPDEAEPLLNLYVAADGEWVIWCPQGYFDASPGGMNLIGWQVNGKLVEAAQYYPATQFKKALYRPDVIDSVLRLGNVKEAIAAANAALPRETAAIDLRDRLQFNEIRPPDVRITSPVGNMHVNAAKFRVVAEVHSTGDAEIRDVRFLVNGRPAIADASVRPREVQTSSSGKDKIAVYEQEVTLAAGENLISVTAATSQASSASPIVRVQFDPPFVESAIMPKLFILAAGCSHYKNESINLKYAASDAQGFVSAWKAQKGQFYRDVETTLLIDEEATSENLRDGMDWLVRSVTQHDLAMIFVSGHGVRDNRNNYYLATHDSDVGRLRATSLPHSDILRLVEDMPCKVLLFVDTCHGGGITGAKSPYIEDPWRDLVSEEVGAILFASSQPRELSLESDNWQHGAFTKALLDVLSDAKGDVSHDGYLSVTELDLQLSERVKQLTAGQQHPVSVKPPTIRNF